MVMHYESILMTSRGLITLETRLLYPMEGDDTLFGYPAQVYYDNKDEPEFYLGIQ